MRSGWDDSDGKKALRYVGFLHGNIWVSLLVNIAPFVLLLGLWFFLLRQMRKSENSNQRTVVEPMRKLLQDEIVPEVRALRESVDALRKEMADGR